MRINICTLLFFQYVFVQAQNQLVIPPSLTGTNFNLNVQSGTQIFYGSTATPTYGINGPFLSPTIIVNKGDSITLNVINNLNTNTTMHWHGLHVSAMNDGGPHQIINPSTIWSPSFKVRNNASTFWYHPHGANQTEQQVSKGLAGLFIVKDSAEAALNLPRTYGIDDIPLIVQNKAFDVLQQIAIATDMDTAIFVNGTLNPYFNAPSQVIRFRLLNGSSLRTYNFGFSNSQTFYQIATDGGLLDTSLALTRLTVSPGERAEILVNFSGMQSQTLYLKSFASELPTGIYGAAMLGFGADIIHEYNDNVLNGADYNVMKINIVAASGSPITTIQNALVPYIPFNPISATNYRTIVMDTIRLLPIDPPNRAEGPFGMNNRTFNMDSINEVVHLNTTEIWTLVNKTLVAHPFHIHDIEFNIIEKSGLPPLPSETGWKDVVLVMPNDSVKFITKFTTFADNTTPYMYHCHLLHHEDDGMMGSFLVIDTGAGALTGMSHLDIENSFSIYPNPTNDFLNINSPNNKIFSLNVFNLLGEKIYTIQATPNLKLQTSNFANGIYFLQIVSDKHQFTRKIIKQ
ncbi:MAG: T9SS type A sorting domain-containing protein [Flavobacteriaceae bacterium]|nr:T9SS type A sorting domain-containing protein [Flavobacteriaceae bacterium]